MRVYRKVLATEVDFQNIGCHTTKDWKVASRFDVKANSYQFEKEEAQREFMIWISAKPEQININATKESNTNYSHEKEVVLLPNQLIKVEIYSEGALIYKGVANTGTRYDKWVENFL